MPKPHIVLDRSKLLGFRICKPGKGSGVPAAMAGKVGKVASKKRR